MVRASLQRHAGACRRANRGGYGTGSCFSPVHHARMRRPILQPAPGGDSWWPRRELRCRPSAHVAYISPQAPHLVPRGSCAGYYPECNPLLPLWHHASRSHVPAAKSIPVRIRRR